MSFTSGAQWVCSLQYSFFYSFNYCLFSFTLKSPTISFLTLVLFFFFLYPRNLSLPLSRASSHSVHFHSLPFSRFLFFFLCNYFLCARCSPFVTHCSPYNLYSCNQMLSIVSLATCRFNRFTRIDSLVSVRESHPSTTILLIAYISFLVSPSGVRVIAKTCSKV